MEPELRRLSQSLCFAMRRGKTAQTQAEAQERTSACVGGTVVAASSFVPQPVALSSAQAEFNAAAVAVTAVKHVIHMYNELRGKHADDPLSVPLYVDSSSAITIMNNDHDNRGTRHIARRFFVVREDTLTGRSIPTKIDSSLNLSDIGTKNSDAVTISRHMSVMHDQAP